MMNVLIRAWGFGIWLSLAGLLFLFPCPLLLSQDRNLCTQRLVLDDDAGDGTTNKLTLQTPNLGTNLTLTLPGSAPSSNGSLLSATTGNVTSWTDSPTLNSMTLTNGLTVSGGVVNLSGAASVILPAGTIGFDDLSSGTSMGESFVIGAGSTLSASGGGVISANEFFGSGSTTESVDLGTAEVSGLLGISNGGTGSGTASGARTNLGLGTIATQDASNVTITGGTLSGITLSAPLTLSGSPASGSMLTIDENGANTPNLLDLQVGGSSAVIVENNGETGFGTPTPGHTVHAVNSQTTDERAALYGEATQGTTNQAVGVWGDANNTDGTNTGTIGLLATGNGNTTAGQTNIAVQVNDGELAVGRTTQTGTGYTVVEGATGGTGYSAQGPSGVIEVAVPGIVIALPLVGQSIFNTTITVNNRYLSSNSIVLVTIQDLPSGILSLLGNRLIATASVSARTAGSFDLTFAVHTLSTVALNVSAGNARIGYLVVNPSR